MTAQIARHGSGGPYEASIGYSRVVVANGFAMTAGCTATVAGKVVHLGDPGAQAEVAIANALGALERVGVAADRVVQSRLYIVDRAHADVVGRVHGSVFGGIRPATTLIVAAGLMDPDMLVEVELVAAV